MGSDPVLVIFYHVNTAELSVSEGGPRGVREDGVSRRFY